MIEPTPMCAAHPHEIALWFCQRCKEPLCDECRVKVYGKSACRPCADELHTRTGAVIEGEAPSSSSASGASYAEATVPPTPARFLLGILIAGVVAIVGAVFWEKLYFYTHHSHSYIYIGIGAGIGASIVHFGKRKGPISGVVAGLLYCVAMLFGHHLYVQDEVGKVVRGMGFQPKPLSLDVTWRYMQHGFIFVHWLFVAVGLFVAVAVGGTLQDYQKKST